jgi:hypothetical protein
MKHPTLIAFTVVMLLAAPGAYRELNADGEAAPSPVRIVKVGDARLAVSLDRTRVHAGEPLKVAMSIENPGPREKVTEVEIAVLERVGSPMARVSPPPTVRHTETVTMVAQAQGTTRQTVALKVPPATGKGAAAFGRTLLVRVTAKGTHTPATIAAVVVPAARAPARPAATGTAALAAAAAQRPTL